MTPAGSVEGDAPLRLFLALRLREDDLDRIEAWTRVALGGCARAEGGRVVPRGHLHVTLAFLGRRPAGDVAAVVETLRDAVARASPIALAPVSWRETRSVGMLVLHDEADAATALATDVQDRLEQLGLMRRESRPWLPHLTVCRFRRPPGLRPATLPGGTCVPSDAAAYVSHLHPSGARYEVLQAVGLPAAGEERRLSDENARGKEPG